MATQVVLLGTGTPRTDPDRAGAATGVIVDGKTYVFDFGPGVGHRISAARSAGVDGISFSDITVAFLTHHHSDHTTGLADLFLTSWMFQREAPLRIFGPRGTEGMCRAVRSAYALDIAKRTLSEPHAEGGDQLIGLDITPGPIYRDDRISVEAFDVSHGEWHAVHGPHPALGYRIETADRIVIVSGDTTWFAEMPHLYDGAHTIVHEVYSGRALEARPAEWRGYHSAAHTSGADLGRVAAAVQPARLVLTHQILWDGSRADLLDEITSEYDGPVHDGADLDVV